MTYRMDMGKRYGQMGIIMKVIIEWGRRMDRESTNGGMVVNMKGIIQ